MRVQLPNADEIDILERYDPEDDVYYVTMKTGEPSLACEHDDRLLVEFGIFTGLPTGFRIFNYTKNKERVEEFKASFKRICKAAGLKKIANIQEARSRRVEKFFDNVMA